jgi:hypothetical protein
LDAYATGSEGPSLPGFTFVEQWGATTWLGRTADGAAVVCERVTLPPEAKAMDGRALRRHAAEALGARHEELLPVRRVVRRGSHLWLLSELDDGVPLHRLLDRGKPSLLEAASLAALVLEAVASLHEAGCAHGGLDSRSVRLGPAGEVRLAGWGPNALFGAAPDDEARRADVRGAAGVVEEIARSAGRPARPLTEQEEKLVARLASAADPRSLRRRGLGPAGHGLELVIGGPERRRAARRGLVNLARAVTAVDAPPPVPSDPGEGAESPAAPGPAGGAVLVGASPAEASAGGVAIAPARRLPPPARRPPIWPRIWKGMAVGAIVAVLLGTEVRFFGPRVQRNVHILLSGGVKPAAAGPRRPAAPPVLGPATAGPITHLELRPLDACRAGAVCNAVAQVTVRPQDQPLEIAWNLAVIDRCRSGRDSRPGGVMSIPPGRDRGVQTVAIEVPEGRSLALIPLTTAPVTVTGSPIKLSVDDGPC